MTVTMQPIYLDYNASTPIDPAVAEAMRPFLDEAFGNPSSGHWASAPASAALDRARARVAALLGAAPEEIVFTSGGSEANNVTIKVMYFAAKCGKARLFWGVIGQSSAAGKRPIVAKRTVLAKCPSENWLTWPQKLAVIRALSLELSRKRSLTSGNVAHFGDVTIVSVISRTCWRREWDSNPRYSFPHTRFPSVRLKPLGHLSGCPLLKRQAGFGK